ncbi:GAF domain-containing protein [Acaryochloris sp. 'Moss Beach']|uniref:hybrid sensor histidine kinase/response regulator n=1 Tax=Acaryochloris sp. 'Moss Beach' TaxID=2740837 RepID=UPI001F441445|nr:ATP-binding protein [Acaryochloris sp. 'Moss Beach']UJB68339.1 GAF domain-containing protein [Acaryochloris sp. 'Moss Beach']
MPVSAPEIFEHTLPQHVYPQLGSSLVDMVRSIPGVAKLLTSIDVGVLVPETQRFTVLTSKSFSALVYEAGETQLKLTFEPLAITTFLQRLYQRCPVDTPLQQRITEVIERQSRKNNDAKLQGQFTLLSLAAMSPGPRSDAVPLSHEVTLHQPAIQERLCHQIISQLSQGVELSPLLAMVVRETRHLLQADRLLIYQLPPTDLSGTEPHQQVPAQSGSVIHEALASSELRSVLSDQEQLWGIASPESLLKYQQGYTLAIHDVLQNDAVSESLATVLDSIQVRALLVTPILVKSGLWGLCIAHQCLQPRQWHAQEQDLLKRIAAHISIAIHQAALHDQVQQHKKTLDEQVEHRTQELQAALLAAQSSNQAKTDFLATMNHELRTPLTCVIGMSATLLRWSLGPLTDKQRSCLQTIHDSGEHLLELINDILDFSHVQSGKATLNISDFSLTTLIQQLLQVMRDKADAHQVQLKANLKIPPERDRFIADLRRVQQILISLIDNAIKFTPMGGKVKLRVWVETNTVVFQVEDTGIGISPSQLPHLFEKFQQLDASYHRTYEGAGLGLALAQQCVTLHQGWIDVSSEEGQGSIFTVQLPNQSALFQQEASSQPLSAGRIVLIEGHEEDATLLCDMLTAANYQVIWMVEASAAIDQIRLLQPIAVIVDAQLPAQGCLSLIRRLRELPGTDKTKIIVLTQEGISKDHQRYLSLGADAYLLKSLQPEDLLRKVNVLLKSASVL